MLIKEFISETNKKQMISILFKHYGVENVKIKEKSIKRHADFDVDRGVLNLSTRYKTVKPSKIKQFLITIIHEIDHARDAKKLGWKKFKDKYEWEQNMIAQGHYPGKTDEYWDNPFEIKAEKFGQDNWKRWYDKFKKEGLF
jgi:hypothetical protein